MKDFYGILGIERAASPQEIKKAYFGMVRKYPPDRHPEEFMRIREAYEALIDEKTRKQYDAMDTLPRIVRQFYDTAREALQAGNSERAVMLLEQAAEYFPHHALVNGLLGDAYLENGNSGKALQVFEQLVAEEPENAAFAAKLANACLMRGWHKKAIDKYNAALQLDEDNISLWLGLIQAFIKSKDFSAAKETALKGIGVGKRKGWDSLELYYHIVLSDIYGNDRDNLPGHLRELKEIALRNETEKGNVAWFLAKLAKEFQTYGLTEISSATIDTAFELLPGDPEIRRMHEEIRKEKGLIQQIGKLKADFSFSPVFAYMFDFEIHKCTEKSCIDCEFEVFAYEMDVLTEIDSYRSEILRLKSSYPELYEMKAGFFANALNAKRFSNFMDGYYKRVQRYMRLCPEKFADDDLDPDMLPLQPAKRDETKVGRNDPCPCGSGKKYKKCCGA